MVGTGGPVATFSVWDYVVFAGTILAAAGIGLFQAIRGRKETSSAEFLLGGRQMTAVPVAMSLTASFMSGITVIGTPAEAYRFGTAFWLFGFSYAIMSALTAEIFVPLFYRLGITSAYEYLEMRFSRPIRVIGTSMYIAQTALYTGLVIYAPALALNQITGLDLWGVLVATGVVCIIYCTLGGLKAVIWTDVMQMVIMLAGFVAVIARGAVLQGGLGKIWEDARQGGRLETFDFDPDPLKRHTFWSIIVGGSVMWVSIYSINQSQVQRYISCKTLGHAKMSLYVNMVGLWVTVSLAMFTGLTMYSIYKECDPLSNGDIGTSDQLLPYLVMDILAVYPGIPGLFVAAAYSGTLSTVSSSINALVAVTMEDFIVPLCKNLTEKQISWMNMGLSVFFGGVCIGMAGVASAMGSVLQAALSIFGMISGPLLGLYLLGMLFRTSNSIGGLVGMIIGLVLTLWVGIGGQIYPPTPEKTNPLNVTTVDCTRDQNYTTIGPWTSPTTFTLQPEVRPPLADSWYSLSYLYFSLLGALTTVVCGLLVSAITGGCKQEKLNSDLFVRKKDLICFRCFNKSKVSDVTEKAEKDFQMGADNPAFTDVDVTSKDVEKARQTNCYGSECEHTDENKDLLVMDNIIVTLGSCLLAISFVMPQTEDRNLTTMSSTTPPSLNLTTFVTSSNFTVNATVFSNATQNTTPFISTTRDNETLNDTTSLTHTSKPTTIMTPLATSSSLTVTPGTHTPALTALTTPAIKTTSSKTAPDTTPITTANSTHVVNTTLNSGDRSTQGSGLNISERNMTIAFSVILGLFTVALVAFMFHRCKHKIQYLHQPLNNTGDTGAFEADDDTLVISGGLYDGHPIYDNVPTAPEDPTEFRLEFL
ncbi:hypothetical protein Q5P01_001340 [Channa striata]|uniref:Sodium-coupled monocarboxylate transporter 1 n=1 Tax=Channa striata TaxID=64152 RepID=A0AA88NMP7_CHASR|nr:hypothetical protein Q5P01_001340 [Channa striata]